LSLQLVVFGFGRLEAGALAPLSAWWLMLTVHATNPRLFLNTIVAPLHRLVRAEYVFFIVIEITQLAL
jgi:hypothetical protein